MDSRYALINKNGSSTKSVLNNFVLKRKFSSIGAVSPAQQQQAKKQKLQATNRNGSSSNGQNGTTNGGKSQNSLIASQRQNLPVFAVRQTLIRHLMQNETLIVIGETGCGKTTQIPQFLYQAGLGDRGIIAVTQPRRVAAITISSRVAKEMNRPLGDLVGYTVRFEDNTTKNTKIRFLTDGSLLREALSDRLLKNYSAIILDEAHERTINTDVLFGIVKEAQRIRRQSNLPALKIIIMSATMDVDHFSKYFNNCKTVYLEGRTHPIKVMQTKEPQTDYLLACMSTFFQIHETAHENHDVLIFLTGQEEIEGVAQQIRSLAKSPHVKQSAIRVFPLYSQLPQNRQMEVFSPLAQKGRKVIISTNIAETSLTIPGIKYVIDSGVVKRRVHDPTTGMDTLKILKISRDQAWQRCGRAGRESSGVCYRTYSLSEYNAMPLCSTPEILRSNIATTVLQLLALGIDCEKFDFIDKPSPTAIENAIKQLRLLGAIRQGKGNDLTQLGKNMSKFPLDPKYSKILLSAPSFGCLEEMLSLVALLSGEEIFQHHYDSEKRADALTAHAKFENKHGDHLTLLNAFKAFRKIEKAKVWCQENYVNPRNLQYAAEVRKQLSEICERLSLDFASCGNNFDQVRKCLISGMFTNIAELHRENHYVTLSHRHRAKIHPSSILSGKPRAKFVLFTELVTTGRTYMRCVTAIEPEWIDEIVPNTGLSKRTFTFNKVQ